MAGNGRCQFLRDFWDFFALAGFSVSTFLFLFGAWVWAQDSLTQQDAMQNRDLAVLQTQMIGVEKRVTAIEDRLFGIFLMVGGALVGSGVSSIFSIRTHRTLRNGRGGP